MKSNTFFLKSMKNQKSLKEEYFFVNFVKKETCSNERLLIDKPVDKVHTVSYYL